MSKHGSQFKAQQRPMNIQTPNATPHNSTRLTDITHATTGATGIGTATGLLQQELQHLLLNTT
jgi:hypothetical protein